VTRADRRPDGQELADRIRNYFLAKRDVRDNLEVLDHSAARRNMIVCPGCTPRPGGHSHASSIWESDTKFGDAKLSSHDPTSPGLQILVVSSLTSVSTPSSTSRAPAPTSPR